MEAKKKGSKKNEAKSPTKEDKKSSSDAVKEEHEKIIIHLAESFGDKGFNDDDVSKMIPSMLKDDRVLLINKLINKGILDIFVAQSGIIVYKRKLFDSSLDPALKGADTEEKVVYGIIKEAGNKGIWMRDIRFKSNLLPTQLNKVLKSLENKKIIKAVKSVAAHKKKVYMLFNLEPDSTLTGGSWYSGEDFESEFVDVLNQQCYRYLLELKLSKESEKGTKKAPLVFVNSISSSPKEVCKFITDLKISNVALSEDDIKTILDTLVYDGKVERKRNAGGDFTYRAVEPLVSMGGVTVVPCAVCPVIQRCHENSFVTSIKCPYIQEWGKKKT